YHTDYALPQATAMSQDEVITHCGGPELFSGLVESNGVTPEAYVDMYNWIIIPLSRFPGPDHTDKWIPVVQNALISRYNYAVFCARNDIDYGAEGSIELFEEATSLSIV
ncbi:hypothetical protein KC909_03795, partial [Candidatus Dojkabacteria bacterium]|nr:hypothetical protein [Candidatus Dojkabacteria bacterium]